MTLPRRLPSVFLLLAFAGLMAGSVQAKPADQCSEIAGHYRVKGSGNAFADVLSLLGTRDAGFLGSEVRIEGSAANYLRVWVKSGESGSFPVESRLSLWHGDSYRCVDGWLVFSGKTESWRQLDDKHYKGSSQMRLRRQGNQLAFEVNFGGREYTTLYSYDSANVSLPKPFTYKASSERLAWPIHEEVVVREEKRQQARASVGGELRRLLEPQLGGLKIVDFAPGEQGAQVSLQAEQLSQVAAFEDRLRAAGLNYEMTRQPTWGDRAYYFDLRISAGARAPAASSAISPFRVQQEVARLNHSLVDVFKAEAAGQDYVASLYVFDEVSTEHVIARIRANTQLFAEITALDEQPRPGAPRWRLLRLLLKLR